MRLLVVTLACLMACRSTPNPHKACPDLKRLAVTSVRKAARAERARILEMASDLPEADAGPAGRPYHDSIVVVRQKLDCARIDRDGDAQWGPFVSYLDHAPDGVAPRAETVHRALTDLSLDIQYSGDKGSYAARCTAIRKDLDQLVADLDGAHRIRTIGNGARLAAIGIAQPRVQARYDHMRAWSQILDAGDSLDPGDGVPDGDAHTDAAVRDVRAFYERCGRA
jgi:hypothetical protein